MAGPAQYTARKLSIDPYLLGMSFATSPGDESVPPEHLLAGLDQRRRLLQGLIAGAGCEDGAGRCRFESPLEHYADAVVELAASLGLRPEKGVGRRRRGPTFASPARRPSSRRPLARCQKRCW